MAAQLSPDQSSDAPTGTDKTYLEQITLGRQKRNSCLFFRKDTLYGDFEQPVCEKKGCVSPSLSDCFGCNLYSSCLNSKARDKDTIMRARVHKKPAEFHRHCRTCNVFFSTKSSTRFHCSHHCEHTLYSYEGLGR